MANHPPLSRDAAGRIVLPQPFPNVGRIFGALYAIPGIKMLWDFGAAVAEVHRAAAWRAWDILGLGVWLLIAAVFLVPGVAIAAIRRRVIIDRAARELVQINDFLVYRWRSRQSLNAFTKVRLFVPRSTTSRIVHYHVALYATSRKSTLVYLADDPDEARRIGREVAEFVALPVDDRLRDAESDDDETELADSTAGQ